jgi:hypothetical protein
MNPLKRLRRGSDVDDHELRLCQRIEVMNKEAAEASRRIRALEQDVAKLRSDLLAKDENLLKAKEIHEEQMQAAIDALKANFQLVTDELSLFITKLKTSLTDLLKTSVKKDDFIAMTDILPQSIARGLLDQKLETNRDSLDLVEFSKISIIDWIKSRAGKLASVTTLKALSNADLMAETPGDVSPLIFFICRMFDNAKVQCSPLSSPLADISESFIAPINCIICSLFGTVHNYFESPLGRMLGFESIVNGNRDELSREIAAAIPGGVSATRFKSKLNLIIKEADLGKIKMESIKDMVSFII